MKHQWMVALLFIALAGCNPFKAKKSESYNNDKSESGRDLSQYMNIDVSSQLARDGSFAADGDTSLQDKFMKKFKKTQCANEWVGFLQRKRFGVLLSQMRPSLKSKKKIVNSDGSESYFMPTTVVGYWVEIRKFQNRSSKHPGRVEIREYAPVRKSASKMFKRIYRWRAIEDCKKSLKTKSYNAFNATKNIKNFTDRDLRKKIKKGAGLIYLWSPQMPYSSATVKVNGQAWGLDALLKVASEKGLDVTFLLDSQAHEKAAKKMVKRVKKVYKKLKNVKLLRDTSVELRMRMTGLHMPTMLYYNHGKIAYGHLPGISAEKQMNKYIKQQEKILANAETLQGFDQGGE